MALGKKLFVSVVVCDLIDLLHLLEGNSSNRGWVGHAGSPMTALIFLRLQVGEICCRTGRGCPVI